MSYRTARTPATLHQDQDEKFVLVQWHNGTDSRSDDLPAGGWEIERKNYPGLRLPIPTGKVLHSNGVVDAWVADELTMAVLDHRLTWYIDDKSQASARDPRGAVQVAEYQPGAWSRLRVLAWCGELNMPVVFTMRASISSDFAKALKVFQNGPLAAARRDNPDLPLCAFWITVSAGPREKRGKGGASSWITPPVFDLPAEDATSETVEQWLEERFVGQEMLDRMAEQAVELLERFRGIGRGAQRQALAEAEPASQDNPQPQGTQCAKGHIYDATKFFVCPVCHDVDERMKEQIREEARAKAEFAARATAQNAPTAAQTAQDALNGAKHARGTTDEFDGLPSASEEPHVKQLLQQAAQTVKEPTWAEHLALLARQRNVDPSDPRVKRVIDAAVKANVPAAYQAAEKTIAGMR